MAKHATHMIHQAASMVENAIFRHIRENVEDAKQQLEREGMIQFVKGNVPRDGLCAYHSVLAGLKYEQWSKIPRGSNGWAINPRTIKTESDDAMSLRNLALATEHEQGSILFLLGQLARESLYTDVVSLSWLGCSLDLAIRCTIDDEVGFEMHNLVLTF